MQKHYGLLHIPDATTNEDSLPAWYRAAEVDEHLAAVGASTQGLLNRVAELEKALRELHTFFEDAPTLRAIVSNALMGSSS